MPKDRPLISRFREDQKATLAETVRIAGKTIALFSDRNVPADGLMDFCADSITEYPYMTIQLWEDFFNLVKRGKLEKLYGQVDIPYLHRCIQMFDLQFDEICVEKARKESGKYKASELAPEISKALGPVVEAWDAGRESSDLPFAPSPAQEQRIRDLNQGRK